MWVYLSLPGVRVCAGAPVCVHVRAHVLVLHDHKHIHEHVHEHILHTNMDINMNMHVYGYMYCTCTYICPYSWNPVYICMWKSTCTCLWTYKYRTCSWICKCTWIYRFPYFPYENEKNMDMDMNMEVNRFIASILRFWSNSLRRFSWISWMFDHIFASGFLIRNNLYRFIASKPRKAYDPIY